MPIFYFDVYDGNQVSCDAFGDHFATAQEAKDQAASLLPDLARDILPSERPQNFAAIVRDVEGDVIYRGMLLYRALKIEDAESPWCVAVSDLQYEITRSEELRRATREIGRDICNNIHGLMATLEEARATMDVTADLISGRPRGGSA